MATSVTPRKLKLGRKPRKGLPMLHLKSYLTTLPPAVPFDWTMKISSFPIMLNDTEADCVAADIGHVVEIFTGYGLGSLVTPTGVWRPAQYQRVGGPGDNGEVITDALADWVSNPMAGCSIEAWAAVDYTNQTELQLAAELFGATHLGINLPNNYANAINNGTAWTDTSERQSNPGALRRLSPSTHKAPSC